MHTIRHALLRCPGLTFAMLLAAAPAAQQPQAFARAPGLHIEFPYRNSSTTLELYEPGSSRVVHSWTAPPEFRFTDPLAKPLPSGELLALVRGRTRKLVALDWASNVKWEYKPPAGRTIHHDFEPLANGHVLLLMRQIGTSPLLGNNPVWDDLVVEIDQNGQVVWQWSTLNHIAQLPITAAEWASLAPHLANLAYVFHANAVQSLPANRWAATDPRFAPGNVLISYRDLNVISIIDRATGNIVWNLRDVTIGQHHAKMIPREHPGAGNILVFDNGGQSGLSQVSRPYTRVVELDPISQGIVWQYSRGAEVLSRFMGAAQRMPNGNTVVTEGWLGEMYEVSPNGAVVWRRSSGQVYRSYRLPFNWFNATMPAFAW